MKRLFITALAAAGLMTVPAFAQSTDTAASTPAYSSTSFLATVRSTWEGVRSLVTNIADSIPEDLYDYKPTPEVRSFREQLIHLAGENYNFFGQVAGKNETPANLNSLTSKDDIMKALRDSYAYGAKVFDSLTEEKALEMVSGRGGRESPRWAPIIGVIQDNMDHYGNLVVYVRLNGMVPPRSQGGGMMGGRGGPRGGGGGM